MHTLPKHNMTFHVKKPKKQQILLNETWKETGSLDQNLAKSITAKYQQALKDGLHDLNRQRTSSKPKSVMMTSLIRHDSIMMTSEKD